MAPDGKKRYEAGVRSAKLSMNKDVLAIDLYDGVMPMGYRPTTHITPAEAFEVMRRWVQDGEIT